MLTEKDRAEVAEYFAVFNPAPRVEFDAKQHTDEESYLLIDGGGLSIGRHLVETPRLGGTVLSPWFRVYNHEGEDDGELYANLQAATKAAMGHYSAELFRRVNDRIVTAALAEEFEKTK